MDESKEITVKGKDTVKRAGEETRPGRVFTPQVDIFEDDGALVLEADMPGVDLKGLDIGLKEDQLTIKGGVKKAHIVNGSLPHALLLEIFTDEGIGTQVIK